MRVLFVYSIFENQGIEYLSAVLKKAGHKTKLIFDPRIGDKNYWDTNGLIKSLFDYKKVLIEKAKKFNPDLIAFSVNSADYSWSLNFARILKKQFKVPIVFGGHHPTYVPETVLENNFIDYVIRGEGEYAFLELVNALEKGKKVEKIENLCYKKNKEIKINKLRPFIQNLDSIPFPDRGIFIEEAPSFKRYYLLITRRGCYNACAYCGNNVMRKIYFGKKDMWNQSYLRRRSVDNVIEELKQALEEYDFDFIRINDDNFCFDLPWLKEFSEKYKKHINKPYKCFIDPISVNKECLKYLKDSNCQSLQIGLQAYNPDFRRNILHRNHTNKLIASAIKMLKESGIQFQVDIILGFPGETKQDYEEMMKFLENNPVDFASPYWLTYFCGSDILEYAKKVKAVDDKFVGKTKTHPNDKAILLPGTDTQWQNYKYNWKRMFALYKSPRWIYDLAYKKFRSRILQDTVCYACASYNRLYYYYIKLRPRPKKFYPLNHCFELIGIAGHKTEVYFFFKVIKEKYIKWPLRRIFH